MEGVHSGRFTQGSFAADQLGATRELNAGSTSAEDKVLHKEGVGAWIIRKIEYIFFAVMGFFGSTWAQFRLGILYLEDSNQEKGLYWVEKSAQGRNITALFELGDIFETGKYGVETNISVAEHWFEKVVERRIDKSMSHSQFDKAVLRLADILLSSTRSEKDPRRALELLLIEGGPLERKHPEALFMAGEILKDRYSDDGELPDLERAIGFLTEAQDLGCKEVHTVLDEALRLHSSAEESRTIL